MLNDVKNLVESCITCRNYRPSQPVNQRTTPSPSAYMGPPLGHVGVDLFDFGGKKFLVCENQWSGYPVFQKLSSATTASILQVLTGWFHVLGWPRSIRSDGSPQFCGDFSIFCEKNNIKHELSAPYNPRSNGLAESAVKIVKIILKKCSEENGNPERALYEWRNLPCNHSYSPAQLIFGRRQRVSLPMHKSAFSQVDFSQAALEKDKKFSSQATN